MQWVGLPRLVGAVSEAGGLGMLTALSEFSQLVELDSSLPPFAFLRHPTTLARSSAA